MDLTSLLFLAIPAGLIAVYFGRRHAVWQAAALYAAFSVALIFGSFAAYDFSQTSATEILNGRIVSKLRTNGQYERAYSCNCRTTAVGGGKGGGSATSCDTCYEDHYTVDWHCGTTAGDIRLAYADWTSSAVYQSSDPERWLMARIGEPVAIRHHYANYVQAVPDSLYQTHFDGPSFEGMIPKYPNAVYDSYKVNRFLPVGVSVPDASEWNAGLAEMLKDRGPVKQVNAIIVVVSTDDERYQYALQKAWVDGGKNDVVLIVGAARYPRIDWVAVMSWTKESLFKIQLRDSIRALGVMDREKVLGVLGRQIDQNFERRHMREFEYLKAEISPPGWVLLLMTAGLLAGACAMFRVGMPASQRRTPS